MADLHVTGLKELQAFMDQLAPKLERNVMRGALRAGVKVIAADAKARCPVGEPSETGRKRYKLYRGALRDSIRIGVFAKGSRVAAYVRVGGRNKKNGADVWYSHLIEFTGATPHLIRAAIGKALTIGAGIKPVMEVSHPGMHAHPFLRPALDSQAQNAVVAAAEYMKKRLATKEGLDTADIEIGGGS